MEGEPQECRRWAIEAVDTGMTAAEVMEELRFRWGLSPISTIKVVREATGIGLQDAKVLVDRTVSPESRAVWDGLLDDLTEHFLAELAVDGAVITLSRPRDTGSGWTMTLAAEGLGNCSYGGCFETSDSIEDAQLAANAVVDHFSRVNGFALQVAWAQGGENDTTLGRLIAAKSA